MIVTQKGRTVDYVLEIERQEPPEKRTVFKLAILSHGNYKRLLEMVRSIQNCTDVEETLLKETEGICKLGLTGWSNLKDEQGQDIPFDVEKVTELFDALTMQELMFAVVEANQLKKADRKNSQSPQASSPAS